MSVQRKSMPAREADLESTAELPVLDVAAYEAGVPEERLASTDTWVIPPATAATVVASVEDTQQRTQIEVDLRALSANLREVEERLTRKGQRLIEIENQLADSRAERVALEERGSALAAELAAARAGMSAAETQAAESRRAFETQVAELHRISAAKATEFQQTLVSRETAAQAQQVRIQEVVGQLAARDRALVAASAEARDLEGRMAAYLEALQSSQGQRGVFTAEIAGLDQEIQAREARLIQTERGLSAQATQIHELSGDLAVREQRVAELDGEVNTLAAALAERNDELQNAERAQLKLHSLIADLTESVATRSERISALEATSASQSETSAQHLAEITRMRRERDKLQCDLTAAEVAVEKLKACDAEHLASSASRHAELQESASAAERARAEAEKLLVASKQSISDLTGELAGARRQLEERTTALRQALDERTAALTSQLQERERTLQAEIDSRDARLQAQFDEHSAAIESARLEADSHLQRLNAAEGRVEELENELSDRQDGMRTLHEELSVVSERKQEVENDLSAAEDTINRLEAELRAKSTRLDELTKASEEWRSIVEEAKDSLAQRDSFIHRLEQEAAQSATLLGSIQQSIRRMDPVNTGNHEIVPEGAVRLLIRTDGDAEVVHVLGRRTTVGRTSDNDLQIDTKFISRHHAVVLAGPNYTIVEDLNSTNGVLVNSRRVTRHTLKDGDAVTIGRTRFRFAVRPTRAA